LRAYQSSDFCQQIKGLARIDVRSYPPFDDWPSSAEGDPDLPIKREKAPGSASRPHSAACTSGPNQVPIPPVEKRRRELWLRGFLRPTATAFWAAVDSAQPPQARVRREAGEDQT
jgi:hypothetical protein